MKIWLANHNTEKHFPNTHKVFRNVHQMSDDPVDQQVSRLAEDVEARVPIETEKSYTETFATVVALSVEETMRRQVQAPGSTDLEATYRTDSLTDFGGLDRKFFSSKWWLTSLFNSRAPMMELSELRDPQGNLIPAELLKASPYARSQTDAALLDESYSGTLSALRANDVKRDNVTLASLDFVDALFHGIEVPASSSELLRQLGEIQGLGNEIVTDIQQFEAQLAKLSSRELWREIVSFLLIAQEPRAKLIKWIIERQHDQGWAETQDIFTSAKLEKGRQIRAWNNNIRQFIARIDRTGDDAAKEDFWALISYASQNPTGFVANPNLVFGNVNWQQLSGCPSAIDFLDTIRHSSIEGLKFIPNRSGRDGITEFEPDAPRARYSLVEIAAHMQEMSRFDVALQKLFEQTDTRITQFQQLFRNTDYFDLYTELNNEIEMSEEGSIEQMPDLRQLVQDISTSLNDWQIGINVENTIFQGVDPRQSPEEAFSLIVDYLSRNPNIRALLDNDIKRRILRYIHLIDEKVEADAPSGAENEENTLEIRHRILRMAKITLERARSLIQQIRSGEINRKLKSNDGQEFQRIMTQIGQLIASFDELTIHLDRTNDSGHKLRDRLPKDEAGIIENVETLKGFRDALFSWIGTIPGERNTYLTTYLNNLADEDVIQGYERAERELRDAIIGNLTKIDQIKSDLETLKQLAQQQGAQNIPVQEIDTLLAQLAVVSGAANTGAVPGGGISLSAEAERIEESAQKLIETYQENIVRWRNAKHGAAGFAFTMPKIAEFEYERVDDYIHFLNERRRNLEARKPALSPNRRPRRQTPQSIAQKFNDNFYREFAKRSQDNARDKIFMPNFEPINRRLWEYLESMIPGSKIGKLTLTNATHQSKLNYPGHIRDREYVRDLTIIGNRTIETESGPQEAVILEAFDQILYVTRPTAGAQQPNIYKYEKHPSEHGATASNTNFNQTMLDYRLAGYMLSAYPENLDAPSTLNNPQNRP